MQYVRTGTHTGIANHFVKGLGSSSNRAALQKALTAGVQEAELCRHRSGRKHASTALYLRCHGCVSRLGLCLKPVRRQLQSQKGILNSTPESLFLIRLQALSWILAHSKQRSPHRLLGAFPSKPMKVEIRHRPPGTGTVKSGTRHARRPWIV